MTDPRHLLATTTRAAWILDVETGEAKLIDQGRGVYYGLSFSEDRIFIACRQVDVGADRDSQENAILCFDRDLKPVDVLTSPFPIRDVHQIAYHAGTLFICSTYDDAVVSHDLASGEWGLWHPFGKPGTQDVHHINSIVANAKGFLLAGNRPHGWFARFRPDRTPAPGRPVPLGLGTHNVWQENGHILVCSSDEGAIREHGGRLRPIVDRGWVRGFARGGGWSYLGVSQNLVRGVRERSDCMILRLQPATDRIARVFSFAGFGMLHDLRLLGCRDETHNGIDLRVTEPVFAALPTAYQTASQPIALDRTPE